VTTTALYAAHQVGTSMAIEQGVDTFTLGPALLPELFKDDATLAAARDFERATTSAASR
jgi:hypothetical protein